MGKDNGKKTSKLDTLLRRVYKELGSSGLVQFLDRDCYHSRSFAPASIYRSAQIQMVPELLYYPRITTGDRYQKLNDWRGYVTLASS